jgi:hypothetical protein
MVEGLCDTRQHRGMGMWRKERGAGVHRPHCSAPQIQYYSSYHTRLRQAALRMTDSCCCCCWLLAAAVLSLQAAGIL